MPEDYTEPDDDATIVRVRVNRPLLEKVEGVEEAASAEPESNGKGFVAAHFEHPNGEEGIFLVYDGPFSPLAKAYDIDPDEHDNRPVVIPFKHKADGGYNFTGYEDLDGAVRILQTADMYERTREVLTE